MCIFSLGPTASYPWSQMARNSNRCFVETSHPTFLATSEFNESWDRCQRGGLRGSALILEAWAALWAAVIWSPKQTPETALGQLLQTSRWTDDGDAGSSPLTQTCALHFIGQHSSDGEECTGSRSHASSRARRVASCYNGPAAGSRVSDKTWDMAESCVYIKCLYLETRTCFSSFIGNTRKIRNSICGLLFDLNFIHCDILTGTFAVTTRFTPNYFHINVLLSLCAERNQLHIHHFSPFPDDGLTVVCYQLSESRDLWP